MILALNWKAKLNLEAAKTLARCYVETIIPSQNLKVIVFPSALHLAQISEILSGSNIEIGAQNMHWEDNGPFTGENCASQLKDLGVQYILLGHSERREFFQESYDLVNRKLQFAIKKGLKPIICVGESREEKEAGITEMVIVDQLESALGGIGENVLEHLIITYEPIWAIGSGQPVPLEDAIHIISVIHKIIKKHFHKKTPDYTPVLYGGSIESKEAKNYANNENINGLLIGRASLEKNEICAIFDSLQNQKME